MTALDSVRRKRTTVMLAISLAMLMMLAGFGYAGYKALRRYEGAKKVTNESQAIPATPVGLLATVDSDNALTTITLLVLRPDGAGGSAVTVPVTVDTTLGYGDERIPFTAVYASGGIDELKSAVENTMAITIDLWQAATPTETEALLANLPEIQVNLPVAVGTDFPAGEATLTPAQAVQVLNHREEGQNDRARRPNVAAVWSGIAAAITASAASSASTTTTQVAESATTVLLPATMEDLFAHLLSGPVGAREIAADVLAEADVPAGTDVEALNVADSVLVLAMIAPRSMSAPAAGLSFRIEAPPGYEARVLHAIGAVLFIGGNVKWVYLNGPVQADTVFLVKQDSIRTQAEDSGVTTAFGASRFESPADPIEDIDVIIQLGTAFLESTDTAMPSTTTTTIVSG
jgi:anionic cell wall polymer biosynthesis LytR-Cps2A-Psr (LCP) family protein